MKVRMGQVDVSFPGYVHIEGLKYHPHPDDSDHLIIEDTCSLTVTYEDGDYYINPSKTVSRPHPISLIAEEANQYGISDAGIYYAWKLGRAAYIEAIRTGATFPHHR